MERQARPLPASQDDEHREVVVRDIHRAPEPLPEDPPLIDQFGLELIFKLVAFDRVSDSCFAINRLARFDHAILRVRAGLRRIDLAWSTAPTKKT